MREIMAKLYTVKDEYSRMPENATISISLQTKNEIRL